MNFSENHQENSPDDSGWECNYDYESEKLLTSSDNHLERTLIIISLILLLVFLIVLASCCYNRNKKAKKAQTNLDNKAGSLPTDLDIKEQNIEAFPLSEDKHTMISHALPLETSLSRQPNWNDKVYLILKKISPAFVYPSIDKEQKMIGQVIEM